MRWFTSSLALTLIASAVAEKEICHQQPYQAFLPLSKLDQADSYCASNFPLVPCMTRITKTATTTLSEVVESTTVTEHFVSEVVAWVVSKTITSAETLTAAAHVVTIIPSPSTTTSTTYTATSVTVHFDSNPLQQPNSIGRRRTLDRRNVPFIHDHGNPAQVPLGVKLQTTSTTTQPALLKSLYAQAGNFISTICSCIQESQECTTTVLSTSTTVTEEVTATSTVYDLTTTKPITTTIIHTVVVTTTETPEDVTTTQAADLFTKTVSRATTTTQYCPASCTAGPAVMPCVPHNNHADIECTSFDVRCDAAVALDGQNPAAKVIPASSHGECMRACDFLGGCNLFTYQPGKGLCMMYREVDVNDVHTIRSTKDSTGWKVTHENCVL